MNATYIVAQATVPSAGAGPATRPQVDPPWYTSQLIPILLLVAIFYVFMFRTKKGEQNKRQQMLNNLKKGDEVQTIGGVFGRVLEIRDDRVQLKVDESSNTKIWFSRTSIHRVVSAEKAEAK